MSAIDDELKRAADANRVLQKENRKLREALEVQRLKDENASLSHGLDFKVSQKKALSVYGLQAMPTSLYKDQWLRVLSAAPDIKRFIAENDGELITKAASRTRPKPTLVKFKRRVAR